MIKGLLITLPEYDLVTQYLSVFSKSILLEAQKNNVPILKLEKGNANRKNFEYSINHQNYKMNVFNGHGDIDCITGHKNEILVKSNVNDHLLKDRINYVRTCWAAFGLGQKSMEKNQDGCFIGYLIPFMFYTDITWHGNPNKDNVAKIFLDTSNLVPISLLKGNTAQEAHQKSKRSMLKAIKKLLIARDPDKRAMAGALWNNYDAQMLIGNQNASL